MKVFTWTPRNNYSTEARQALCFWLREWHRLGFDPFVVTPDQRSLPDIAPLVVASQCPDPSMWERWAAPNLDPNVREAHLIVESYILPVVHVDLVRGGKWHHYRRLDKHGRVIAATRTTAPMLNRFLAADWTVFKGEPFTDWDLLLELLPLSPTADACEDFGFTDRPGIWFTAHTETDLLLRRKESYMRNEKI